MLRDGIWPRFSEEEFSWLNGSEFYIAFPISSFCDIPIRAAKHHRAKYGDYAVAIHKNYAVQLNLTPVWYIVEDSFCAEDLRQRFPRKGRFTLQGAKHCDLFPFLPLMKVAVGTQPSRDKKAVGHEAMDFVEECEWRFVCRALSSEHWRQSYSRGFVVDSDHQKTLGMKIKLRPEMIAAVFAPTTQAVKDLRQTFPSLCSLIRRWSTH